MKIRKSLAGTTLLLLLPLLNACMGMPDGVTPVTNFDLQKYLGTWYEVARLDHSFERGLTQVTAEYTLRTDGGVKVINRGFNVESGEWEQAEGKAFFVGNPSQGYLKVSFFGPFYGSYVVFELDQQDYQYAFVSGPDLSYLWLLSRSPAVQPAVIERFKQQASQLGFNTEELIMVQH